MKDVIGKLCICLTLQGEWESTEASEDVFKDLLRVKKLSQRVSSVESKTRLLEEDHLTSLTLGDGMPSMASVTDDNASILSESSDLQVTCSYTLTGQTLIRACPGICLFWLDFHSWLPDANLQT